MLPSGPQRLGAVADERGRGGPGGAVEGEAEQCLAAVGVGEAQEGPAVETHHVEQHQVDGDGGRAAGRPGGCVRQTHTGLEQLEARPAVFVEGEDLTVQDRGAGTEGGGQGAELGVRAGDLLSRAGAQYGGAVAGEIDHRPLAVLFGLVGPAGVRRWRRQRAGCGEHGRDQGRVTGEVWTAPGSVTRPPSWFRPNGPAGGVGD
ncbi:hypothetical protein SHKM778_41050 [Streptomyces sp. KM77-8]|uniref:Uncharacterized protein n=1 Tax=Streptomyces haneummycinicus TaxID=3074435 RepID=A0AAT9HJV6_9ACTN